MRSPAAAWGALATEMLRPPHPERPSGVRRLLRFATQPSAHAGCSLRSPPSAGRPCAYTPDFAGFARLGSALGPGELQARRRLPSAAHQCFRQETGGCKNKHRSLEVSPDAVTRAELTARCAARPERASDRLTLVTDCDAPCGRRLSQPNGPASPSRVARVANRFVLVAHYVHDPTSLCVARAGAFGTPCTARNLVRWA